MSYKIHMRGYDDLRTLYQIDALYAWKHDLYFPPVLVEISPTHTCNQKCRYCYAFQAGEKGDRLDDELLIRTFTDVADAGVKAVLVQGTGEPLVHKGLPAAIEAGAEKNLAIGLTTNGVLLNPTTQSRIFQHLHYTLFSVIDTDSKRYAFQHGCDEKQHKNLMENISHATNLRARANLSLGIWATVYLYRDNFHDAFNMVRQCKELGLDYVTVQEATYTHLSPIGRECYASDMFSKQEIDDMKSHVLSLSDDDFKVKVRFPLNDHVAGVCPNKSYWKSNHCKGVDFYALISSDGNVYPCWRFWGKKEYSYGNLNESSFEQIWRNKSRRNELHEYINNIPPEGDECMICNLAKVNQNLFTLEQSNTHWKEFIT